MYRMSNNINQNSKSIFARLLATEDITVIHTPGVQTASFDLKTRTMHLPMWKEMNNHLYDMLIAHEVGHAIYTPNHDNGGWETASREICPENPSVGQMYLNIVEDARIERMIQKKYPGSRKDFWFGYENLHERDVFDIADKNIKELSLIDRLNIKFKIGSFVDVGEFSPEEQEFYDRINSTHTWEDVVSVAKDLYDYMAEEAEKNEEFAQVEIGGDNPGEEGNQDGKEQPAPARSPASEENKTNEQTSSSGQDKNEEPINSSAEEGTGNISGNVNNNDNMIPSTQKSFEEKLSQIIVDDTKCRDVCMLIPEPKIENIVIPQAKVLDLIRAHFADNVFIHHRKGVEINKEKIQNLIHEFQKSAKSSVDLLCKQFEMKKAADVHKRTSVRRTGLLDMDRLHSYKITDNIFLSRNTVKEGKNHGLIMFIDWSGSMGNTLGDTLRQMMVLMSFCRRCNIPYEIYAFASRHPFCNYVYGFTNTEEVNNYLWEKTNKTIPYLNLKSFSLLNLFSSSSDKNDEFEMLTYVMGYAFAYEKDAEGRILPNIMESLPGWFHLNSTPLEEAITCIPALHSKFVAKHGRAINHIVMLTDGEGDGAGNDYCKSFIDPKTKGRYQAWDHNKIGLYRICGRTQAMIEWAKDRTDSNIVCIQLYSRPGYTHYMFDYGLAPHQEIELTKKNTSSWNKEGYVDVPSNMHSFDSYFIVKAKNAVVTEDFDSIDTTNMTPAKIKTSFIKHQKKKFMSRYMINRFVEMIAV